MGKYDVKVKVKEVKYFVMCLVSGGILVFFGFNSIIFLFLVKVLERRKFFRGINGFCEFC